MPIDDDRGRQGGRESGPAFQTISEVARQLELPPHVLRFWETKFNQVKPLKRGGGRRYYRPEDVELLRRIQRLLHAEGYTIKGAQRVLRDGGVEPGLGRGMQRDESQHARQPEVAPSLHKELLEIYEDLLELRRQLTAVRDAGADRPPSAESLAPDGQTT